MRAGSWLALAWILTNSLGAMPGVAAFTFPQLVYAN